MPLFTSEQLMKAVAMTSVSPLSVVIVDGILNSLGAESSLGGEDGGVHVSHGPKSEVTKTGERCDIMWIVSRLVYVLCNQGYECWVDKKLPKCDFPEHLNVGMPSYCANRRYDYALERTTGRRY